MPISFFHHKENLHDILTKIENLPFQFYIAGSRYMGLADDYSDWDFIVQDSGEVRAALGKIGFIDSSIDNSYLDNNCSLVLCYHNSEIPIHIQLSKNIESRLSAQLVVRESGLAPVLHSLKRSGILPYNFRTAIWNTIFAMLDGQFDISIKELLNSIDKEKII